MGKNYLKKEVVSPSAFSELCDLCDEDVDVKIKFIKHGKSVRFCQKHFDDYCFSRNVGKG